MASVHQAVSNYGLQIAVYLSATVAFAILGPQEWLQTRSMEMISPERRPRRRPKT